MSVSWLLLRLELVITCFLCFLCFLHVLHFRFISFLLDCLLLAVSLFTSDYFSVLIRQSTSTASTYSSRTSQGNQQSTLPKAVKLIPGSTYDVRK